jgi:ribosomal protein S12
MYNKVTNMKELCAYAKAQRKLKADEHRRLTLHNGRCSGLTDAEYRRVKHSQKSTFSKARKFTHNRMWKYQSRYSVEQLKQIKKL